MFANFDSQTKQILSGNIWLIVCFVFYLAWWLIAFHPTHGIRGMKTGWLLIPAVIFGVLGVVEIIGGSTASEAGSALLSPVGIAVGAVILYIVLFAATFVFLKRQVTTELFLIVGWGALMLLEMSALYGLGHYSRTAAILLMVIIVIAAAVSLVCYLLYYNLDSVKGYVDGTIPLLIAAVMMTVVTVGAVW